MKIKVFCSESLEVEWSVQGRHRSYSGTMTNREAVASIQNKSLNIYIKGHSLWSPGTLLELSGDICDIFLIPDGNQLLMAFIISENDMQKIEEKLRAERIPELSSKELSSNPGE